MHTTALYLKTNSFTISIMHFIGSRTKQHKKERKKSVSTEPRTEETSQIDCSLAPAGLSAARAPLGSPSSSSSWKFLPSQEKSEEELNSSFATRKTIDSFKLVHRKAGSRAGRAAVHARRRLLVFLEQPREEASGASWCSCLPPRLPRQFRHRHPKL